jgi:hypothetical protein
MGARLKYKEHKGKNVSLVNTVVLDFQVFKKCEEELKDYTGKS